MVDNLSSAAKRAAGKATKLSGAKKASAEKLADIVKPSATTTTRTSSELSGVAVPKLMNLTPELTAGMVPEFEPEQFAITDLANPPETLPQMNDSEREKRLAINHGAQNVLDVSHNSLVTIEKSFNVAGQHAKTVGAGVKASTEIEKTKGLYLDYLSQVEATEQKGITHQVAQFRTASDRTKAGYTMDEISEKEEQARIAAEKARDETTKRKDEMLNAKAKLGALPLN